MQHGKAISECPTNIPDERGEAIDRIIGLITDAFPDLLEHFDYRMPAHALGDHILCAVAGRKHDLAFYVIPHDLMNDRFVEEFS